MATAAEDLLLMVVDPRSGRLRLHGSTLRGLVTAACVAEAVHRGQLLRVTPHGRRRQGDQVCAVERSEEPGRAALGGAAPGPASPLPDASSTSITAVEPAVSAPGEARAAAAAETTMAPPLDGSCPDGTPEDGNPPAGPPSNVPPARATATGSGITLVAAMAKRQPMPVHRLIRHAGRPVSREVLEQMVADGRLHRQRRWTSLGRVRWLADPVGAAVVRDALRDTLSAAGLNGQASLPMTEDTADRQWRAHLSIALLVGAGARDLLLTRHDPAQWRVMADDIALESWAVVALRRSLGLDPLRPRRNPSRGGRTCAGHATPNE